MSTIEEIDAQSGVYKEKIAAREAAQTKRDASYTAMGEANAAYAADQTAYEAAVAEADAAEKELQRLNDEHTAEGVEPPPGGNA